MIIWAQESTRDKALAVPGVIWIIVVPDALVESAGGFEQAIATGAHGLTCPAFLVPGVI